MAIEFGKRLGFGALRLPLLDPKDQSSIDHETLNKMIDVYLERGFTYFDTSYIYHNYQSEIALRESLVKRHPRDSFMLSTKLPIKYMQTNQMQEIFNEQLQKCGVEYFDFYLLHSMNSSAYENCKKWDTFSFLLQKKAEGKFREFGISLHDSPEFLDLILTEHPEIDFVVEQINYIDWINPTIRSKDLYDIAVKHNKPIVVMEACKGGTLVEIPDEARKLMLDYNPEASIASWAYRYAASLPQVRIVLAGMPKMEFLYDNLKTMENFVPLNQEEYKILDEVVKIINANTTVPCTGCRYCEPVCPRKMVISEYFNLYNDYMRLQKNSKVNFVNAQSHFYNSILNHGHGAASSCVKCKKCEKVCPQKLPISDLMEDVAAGLEGYKKTFNLATPSK